MTYTVLDIGAGSRGFGKALRRRNWRIPMLVLCGEPEWGLWPLIRPISQKRAERLIRRGARGVYRVIAEYDRFGLPDQSLDMVTLNAPHPFTFGIGGMSVTEELERCLKPGGLFFSSYPRYDLGHVPKNFVQVATGRWRQVWETAKIDVALPKGTPRRFPQSLFIWSNLWTHLYGNPRAQGMSYIYYDGICAGWKLWMKPL